MSSRKCVVEGIEVLGEYNDLKFTAVYFENETGINEPVAEVTHIINACYISDDGWLYSDDNMFEEKEIKEVIKNHKNEYWTEEIIEKLKIKIEKEFIEKNIKFNSNENETISLEEIQGILDNIGY